MKNRRDVCYEMDAGFIEFNGLSGLIKTRCTATPTFKSRYCIKHIDHACTELLNSNEQEEGLDVTSGPTLRHHQPRKTPEGPVAETILETRKQQTETWAFFMMN